MGNKMDIDKNYIRKVVIDALEEDFGEGDITTEFTIGRSNTGHGNFIAKGDGVLAGFDLAEIAYDILADGDVRVLRRLEDGEAFEAGTLIGEVEGDYAKILSGERTVLNFIQHLSGIASETNRFVKKIAHTEAKLLDTRKTTPGLRFLEKYAVRMGGGTNHRMGLYDMLLIKENHLTAGGGLRSTLRRVLDRDPAKPIEVEVKTLEELRIALKFRIDRIMLDNFSPELIKQAISIRSELNKTVPFEASGNITIENIAGYAETGVEFISTGFITHSAKSSDISLLIDR